MRKEAISDFFGAFDFPDADVAFDHADFHFWGIVLNFIDLMDSDWCVDGGEEQVGTAHAEADFIKRHVFASSPQNECSRDVEQQDIEDAKQEGNAQNAEQIGDLNGGNEIVLTVGIKPRKQHGEKHFHGDEERAGGQPD